MSFALGIIGSSCGVLGVSLSWLLVAYFGRRALYLWGTAINASFCLILGIVASAAHGPSASWAQAVLGILISFMMNLILGPISYTIIAETSSVRLRPLTTGFGRAIYYVANVPTIFRESGFQVVDWVPADSPLISLVSDAQSYWLAYGWQVWLCLVRNRHVVLHRGILRTARMPLQILQRARHLVQPSHSGSQVPVDDNRGVGRRVKTLCCSSDRVSMAQETG